MTGTIHKSILIDYSNVYILTISALINELFCDKENYALGLKNLPPPHLINVREGPISMARIVPY